MDAIVYGDGGEMSTQELSEFYGRLRHDIAGEARQLETMRRNSTVFVTARAGGQLIGVARGISDGLRGFLAECKLDPQFQGPAAVTRTDGRIEHDQHGIAAEMARRVLRGLRDSGVNRIDVLAYGTEVDFCEELGFKRAAGLVGLTLKVDHHSSATAGGGSATASA